MTKKEFLDELSRELDDLSKEERNSALKYYEDYFDDAGSENESDVIKELGSPKKVAEVIKKENSDNNRTPKESNNKSEPMSIWLIILIAIILVPVGFPLLIGLLGTIFGIFMGLVGVFIGLICAGIGTFVSGIVLSILGIIAAITSPVSGLLMIGVGFVLIGIGSILTFVTVKLCIVVIPPIIRGIVELFRLPFKKRGA